MRKTLLLATAVALASCGGSPSGKLNGKVSVTGGTVSAGNISVTAIGPNGGGASTDMSGGYEIDGLADGNYTVSALLAGTTEGEVRVFATVKGGKGSAPELKFTALTPPMPAAGVVTGKASYSDGSDASGITVTLTGPGSQGIAAMTDGTFTFNGVPPGLYTLAADAADSLEHRLSLALQVTGGMTVTVPNLTLTAVGTVTGKATRGSSATGNAGITVAIAGTSYRAITADDGSYTLSSVPAGMQTLIATLPDFDPASAMVTVTRGSTAAMDLTISNLTTRGSVTGAVAFTDQQDRSIITVRADGTTLSTHCDSDGNFTLALPTGHFSIVADAPNFPSRPLGQVAVDDGTIVALPSVVLSPWVDFPVEPGVVATPTLTPTQDGDHALYVLDFASTTQFRMVDLRTGATHTFFTYFPVSPAPVTSLHGRYVAVFDGAEWIIFDSQTAAYGVQRVASAPPVGGISTFSSDEKFFVVADTAQVHRFEVATAIDTPITGVASTDFFNDRFLVRDVATTPYALSYATTSGTPTSVATGVTKHTNVPGGPTVIWSNCGSSCALHLLDPATGTVTNPSGAFASTLSAYHASGSTAWVQFVGTGGGFMNVATTNFTVTPVNFGSYAFNPSGTSVLYEILTAPIVLHLESGAPTGAGTTIATSNDTFGVEEFGRSAWLSDKRAIAFSSNPLARYDILNGTVTTDTDLFSVGSVMPPIASWEHASLKSWTVAEREYADLVVTYQQGSLVGSCESLDGTALFVGVDDEAAPAYQNTLVRNNATGVTTTVRGTTSGGDQLCVGNTSAGAFNSSDNELLVATGQTIAYTVGHDLAFSVQVKSASSGVTHLFGKQTGAIEFPALMVVP